MGKVMRKDKMVEELKDIQKLLCMTNEEYAEDAKKRYGCDVETIDVYAFRTGVVVARLGYILGQTAGEVDALFDRKEMAVNV